VWAEVRSDAADQEGVLQVSRVGVRLYVSVGPGNAPAADFEIESLTAMRSDEGQPLVVATVRNTGGRALDMGGTLRLVNGPGGLSAGPFPAVLGTTLAIGETESVTLELDGQVPAGPWDARIALHSGLLERTARATITFPAVGSAAPVKTTTGGTAFVPFLVGGASLLLIVLTALFVSRRRRKRRGRAAPAPRARREPVAVP
jgi:LPXTG-motif cell wall-anchored protein